MDCVLVSLLKSQQCLKIRLHMVVDATRRPFHQSEGRNGTLAASALLQGSSATGGRFLQTLPL